jgi:hypothetical protein
MQNRDQYGIYFLLRGNEIIYIGQTKNIETRLLGHKDKSFDSHRFIPCPIEKLNKYESRWIIKFNPIYNKSSQCHYNRGDKKPGREGIHNIRIRKYLCDMADTQRKKLGLSFNAYIEMLIMKKCSEMNS